MKGFFKKIAVGLALAASAFVANAAGYVSSQTIDLTYGTANVGTAFAKDNSLSDQSFISKFNFNVLSGFDFEGALLSLKTAKTDLSFSGFDLFTSANQRIATGSIVSMGGLDLLSLVANNLGAGSYYLQVTGTVLGATGGAFGGEVAVSPVPEPATWGMMIGGLGLVGFIARRRKADKADGPSFNNAMLTA